MVYVNIQKILLRLEGEVHFCYGSGDEVNFLRL